MTRYAVYFAPKPNSALFAFGRRWLGRDPRSGTRYAPPALEGIDGERITAITAEPRRYGLHATLKPPFALAPGRHAGELIAAVAAFARERDPFAMPPLRLAEIGGFLALVPSAPSAELEALASAAVEAFDAFRRPPTDDELARRVHPGLDARERELLVRWGYPYVLDRWRFHVTLTGRLEDAERARVRAALEPLVAPLCRDPLTVDALALFVEPGPGAPFHDHSRFALGRAA